MTGVGLLGCGAMGREIATAVCSGKAGDATLVVLFDETMEMARSLAQQVAGSVPFASTFEEFLATPRLELVVECASANAVRAYAEGILSQGKDLLLMSSGALAESSLYRRLETIANQQGCRLMVPSGGTRRYRRHTSRSAPVKRGNTDDY